MRNFAYGLLFVISVVFVCSHPLLMVFMWFAIACYLIACKITATHESEGITVTNDAIIKDQGESITIDEYDESAWILENIGYLLDSLSGRKTLASHAEFITEPLSNALATDGAYGVRSKLLAHTIYQDTLMILATDSDARIAVGARIRLSNEFNFRF